MMDLTKQYSMEHQRSERKKNKWGGNTTSSFYERSGSSNNGGQNAGYNSDNYVVPPKMHRDAQSIVDAGYNVSQMHK